MSLRTAIIISGSALVVALAAACGGRNLSAFVLTDELPSTSGIGGAGQAGHGGSGGLGGDGGGGEATGGSGGEGGGNITPFDCFGCIADNCPEAMDCITDPACINGVVCGVSDCLGGGTPDVQCFVDCFDGDQAAAFAALQTVGCIFGDCAAECGDLLPI